MKSSFVVVMSLMFCSLIYPQDSTSNPKYALSFGIADNFQLDRFNMDIAAKIIDDTHQLRLFLSPRISSSNEKQEVSNNSQNQERELFNYSLGVGADYLWKLMTNKDINMFGGTGLIFTYGSRNEKVTSIATNNKATNELNNPYTNIGIRGILGVEWKVTSNIGIHSEYLVTGSYNWNKLESKSSFNGVDNPTVTRKSSGITLGSGVLFGVSIYL